MLGSWIPQSTPPHVPSSSSTYPSHPICDNMNHTLSEAHANPDVNSLHDRMATASHPARGSTPIKPKSHTERLFSTYSHFCHPLLMSIGQDLGKSMVGPMPVQWFLDAFLPIPHISGHRRSSRQFKKGTFQTTIDATDELKMYGPFVSEANVSMLGTQCSCARLSPWVNLPHSSFFWILTVEEMQKTGIPFRPSPTSPFITGRLVTTSPQAVTRH